MLRFVSLSLVLAAAVSVSAERPKLRDHTGKDLVPIADITSDCSGGGVSGYGVVNDSLEKCEKLEAATDADAKAAYEEYKCKHLRVHAHLVGGVCQCKDMWKGPICNVFHGCPDGYTIRNKSCSPDHCHNGGTIAVGEKEVECTCPVPWDGRFCERLACWRKTPMGFERRFRNSADGCKCGDNYAGENCGTILSCKNDGKLLNGKCECAETWHGEICEKKCPKGQLTCASCGLSAFLVLVVALFFKW